MVESMVVEYIGPLVNKLPYMDLSHIFYHPDVQKFIDILSSISYFFPWHTVLGIVSIMIGINTVRLILAFLKALWNVLPWL